ncbi:MAG TPA: hypothetical protein VEL74_10855 [Thermoanaerobaculia bacterium]|nr:hypothetical protein [Thermoanaerobaculia bacterium]
MATLREQLTKILPSVLPDRAEDAINGTDLLATVRGKLDGDYSEASVRTHFSVMSADPTSPIAKVDQGHGYYRRSLGTTAAAIPIDEGGAKSVTEEAAEEFLGQRASQREEKFRSIYMRYAEITNQFPMHVEHTKGARQRAGVNKWKFPDVVVLRWEVGEVSDAGFRLAREVLEVKKSLGEQPFKLISSELKVELAIGSFREAFFQCVSNSKWAHSAQLAVAAKINDESLAEELRRLGTSYDVSVVSYGLEPEYLDSLPPADKILKMQTGDFEAIAANVAVTRVATGRDRETLDWEHLRDLRAQSEEFSNLFRWTAYCLEKKSPYRYEDWEKIARLESRYT